MEPELTARAHDDAKLTDEAGRLAALRRYRVLDTAPEESFDKITDLVRQVLAVPIAAVSLIDSERQWFKSRRGLVVDATPRAMAFCDHTIRGRATMVSEDARADPRFSANPLVLGAPHIGSYAGVPLTTPDGYNVGALCAIDQVPRHFSPVDLAILERFGALVVDELELRQIAGRDDLTGALTRRAFRQCAEAAIGRHHAFGEAAALVLLDIDHFKLFNDRHGHAAGDRVLRDITAACRAALPAGAILGRVGGEEFAVLLSGANTQTSLATAVQLGAVITATRTAGITVSVTASFGVAPLTRAIDRFDAWLEAADAPLYAAKRAGRNCCLLAA